jgi:hypothetical protein
VEILKQPDATDSLTKNMIEFIGHNGQKLGLYSQTHNQKSLGEKISSIYKYKEEDSVN